MIKIKILKDRLQDGLKGIFAKITPEFRVVIILCMLGLFGLLNFYITFRTIYNIGKEDAAYKIVDSQIIIPDFRLQQQDSNEFLNNDFFDIPIKTEQNDSTTNQ